MIAGLYDVFKHWSDGGSVYIISDTHFEDGDCKYMDADWPDPQTHINNIKKYVHKNDTLIHLGDVGNPKWLEQIKAYKVLIMGNHDQSTTKFRPYFDEIYPGPVFISDKILLSHEPIYSNKWFNIHGHNHNDLYPIGCNYRNLVSNCTRWGVFNLGQEIKRGLVSKIDNIHRVTIDQATERKYGIVY